MIEDERQIQAEMRATLALIKPFTAMHQEKPGGSAVMGKRRVGGPNDGGYVMLNDLDRIGVCYSLGIGLEVSWDLEMAERGALVYQYDNTVDGPPVSHPNFRYFKIGITHDGSLAPAKKRLDTLLHENGHIERDDMILKMDIEADEWDCLDQIHEWYFTRFQQMVIEFHGVRLLDDRGFRERAHRIFTKIDQTHCAIHVHANNFADMFIVKGIPIADVIELTFIKRDGYSFVPCYQQFPEHLDAPNDPARVDLILGSFSF